MNKYLILILLIIISTPIFGQADSTKVPFVAYWSLGDSYDFKVTKIKKRWSNDSLIKNDSTQYIANFRVMDSTDKSYTVQWSYKNNLINTYKKSLDIYNEDEQAVNDIVNKYGVTKVLYKTDEYGMFLDIINWNEISKLMNNLFEELEESILIREPSKAEEIKKAMKPFFEIYSSKEGIEQLLLNELQFFHFPMGDEYDVNIPYEYEQELPNFVGGEPIKGNVKLSIVAVNHDDFYCVLKEEVTINPEDTKRQIIALLSNMGVVDDKAKELLETAIFDITDENYYQYYYDPGIPHRIYGSRTTILEMDNIKFEDFNELEIELIYDE